MVKGLQYTVNRGKDNLDWRQILYYVGCRFDDENYDNPLPELSRLKQTWS